MFCLYIIISCNSQFPFYHSFQKISSQEISTSKAADFLSLTFTFLTLTKFMFLLLGALFVFNLKGDSHSIPTKLSSPNFVFSSRRSETTFLLITKTFFFLSCRYLDKKEHFLQNIILTT